MAGDALSLWIVSCLLVGLRIAPVFAFAPPFTLVRVPRLIRLLLGLGLSVCVLAGLPPVGAIADLKVSSVVLAAAHELLLGATFVLAFQAVFGALYFAGRTIDVQAGLGFAMLVDPSSRTQQPLVGTLFALTAGFVFFSADGHLQLLRMFTASFNAIPLGTWVLPHGSERLTAFMTMAFVDAIGIAGLTILVLFLVDMMIAMLSRTVPQMNVLILGFQVKTIVLILVLPSSFGVAGALFARLMALTLEGIPKVL
jgi:flagellar biosynthesis protein FliR